MYLPKDVIYNLNIKEGDELHFLKEEKYYIFANSGDIIDKLTSKDIKTVRKTLSEQELLVLKKLDSFRYKQRTEEEVGKKLVGEEREVLKDLIKKRYVVPIESNESVVYSINDVIYKKFLIKDWEAFDRKNRDKVRISNKIESKQYTDEILMKDSSKEDNKFRESAADEMRRNGYVVLNTKSEAENASVELEEEIRRGLVLGTRAFNKKYYIVHRAFVNKNSPKLIDALKYKDMSTDELSKKTGVDADGVRSIMFILAENGEVMEARRDLFSLIG